MTDGGLSPLVVAGRIARLRSLLGGVGPDGGGADGLLVTTLANVRWLTGFTGSAGLVLVTADRTLLTTDGRYRTQAAEQLAAGGVADEVELVIGGVAAQREALVAAGSGLDRLGLEAIDVSWAVQRTWAGLLAGVELVPTERVVEELRAVKDAGEIDRMARAAAIADAALADVLPLLAALSRGGATAGGGGPVLTEARFAAELDHAMRLRGAEEPAFETIVAAGENSAKPHHRPGPRAIRPGDPVVVDFGATAEGYRSDMTRTFCVGGEPTGELARVFEVVARSQRAGVAAVAPGVTAGAVDTVCRDVIVEAGWGDRFEHGTGHGVGLDIHEAPSVGAGSAAILEPGTVVTVEPGVYLPGTGGVRIEDTLVVTAHGCRPLTQFPKEVVV